MKVLYTKNVQKLKTKCLKSVETKDWVCQNCNIQRDSESDIENDNYNLNKSSDFNITNVDFQKYDNMIFNPLKFDFNSNNLQRSDK